ncbi:hypothetical protein Tco_0099590 [Tanacetum coccineum]
MGLTSGITTSEVPAEATQLQTIDWSDPLVLRYHALQIDLTLLLNLGIEQGHRIRKKIGEKKGSKKHHLQEGNRVGYKQSGEKSTKGKKIEAMKKEELKSYLDMVQENNLIWKLNL